MIKVYSTPTCPWCVKVKEFFSKKGIDYEDLDVSSDESARKDMIEKSGQMGVPVIDIDGQTIIGYDIAAIENALAKKS